MNSKRILITGATGGIGAALVREYASAGVDFLLLGRDPVRLAEAAETAKAAGASVTTRQLDALDSAGFAKSVGEFCKSGVIDIAILAAGVKTGNVGGVEPPDQAARVLDVNLKAVVEQTETLLPYLMAQGHGQIVVFSSIAAMAPQPDLLSYSASKAGLRAYGVALRRALRGSGVSVHVISPGFVDTPMTDRHHGPTPMKITATRAARVIRRDLEKGRALIAFPTALVLLVRLQNLLPPAISDLIDRAFRAEIVPDDDETKAKKG